MRYNMLVHGSKGGGIRNVKFHRQTLALSRYQKQESVLTCNRGLNVDVQRSALRSDLSILSMSSCKGEFINNTEVEHHGFHT